MVLKVRDAFSCSEEPLNRFGKRSAILFLVVTGILVRAFMYHYTNVVYFSDSSSYLDTAKCLLSWDFSTYTGFRTWGYPLVLALFNLDGNHVWLFQMFLGIFSSVLFLDMLFLLTGRLLLSTLFALYYTLSIHMYFEAQILTEPLTTFLFNLSVYFLLKAWLKKETRTTSLILLGFTASLLSQVRPNYALFVLLCGFITLLLPHSGSMMKRLLNGVRFALPVALVLFSVVGFNRVVAGLSSTTSMTGIALMSHMIPYMELADDRYAKVRDIVIDLREQVRKEGKSIYRDTTSRETPAVREKLGYSAEEASEVFTKIALELIMKHPDLYLKSVYESWKGIWNRPIYWYYWNFEKVSPHWVERICTIKWRLEEIFLEGSKYFFLFATLYFLFLSLRKEEESVKGAFCLSVSAIIFLCSVGNSMFMHPEGESARYFWPMEPVQLFLIFVALGMFLNRRRRLRVNEALSGDFTKSSNVK